MQPTSNIYNIDDYRPHNQGPAFCLMCKYEWQGVAPTGVVWLECPDCGSMKGIFRFNCEKEKPQWTCHCGNQLFYITAESIYCPCCGADQHGFW